MNARSRLWLAGAAALAVLATLAWGLGVEYRASARQLGFAMQEAGACTVTAVMPRSPAARGGLRTGDRIVSVNGAPVRSVLDYQRLARTFRRGVPVRLVVEREGRPVELHIRPGYPFWTVGRIATVVVVLAYLALAVASLLYGAGDPRASLLFWFSVAVALEIALPDLLVGFPRVQEGVIVATFLLNGIQAGIELHLASVVPEPRPVLRRHPRLVLGFYAVGGGIGLVGALTAVSEFRGLGWFPWTLQQAAYAIFDVGFFLWAAAVCFLLYRGVRTASTPRGRHQALLILMGVLPWAVLATLYSILDLLGSGAPTWISAVQPYVLLVYPVAVFAAIFRYGLFDIEVVVRRGLAYAGATALLLAVFYAVLGTVGALLSPLLGEHASIWVFSSAALVLGLLASPLYRLVHRTVETRFFPERRALQERLADLADRLPALGSLEAMGRHLVRELAQIFRVEPVTLMLADTASGVLGELATTDRQEDRFERSLLLAADDPGIARLKQARRPAPVRELVRYSGSLAQRARDHRATYVVPLLSRERLVGLVFLGDRTNGEPLRREELELLTLFGHGLASVLENVRLFHSATYEGLTGLLRREAILERLGEELQRAARYERPLSVAMADLDHFKEVNDTHGHLTGDALLKAVAHHLKSELRSADAVGRYGGEEFLIVLPETDLDGALAVAEKIRERIQTLEVVAEDGTRVPITVSIGVATAPPASTAGLQPHLLIETADRNLLEAKRLGRNRVIGGRLLP